MHNFLVIARRSHTVATAMADDSHQLPESHIQHTAVMLLAGLSNSHLYAEEPTVHSDCSSWRDLHCWAVRAAGPAHRGRSNQVHVPFG